MDLILSSRNPSKVEQIKPLFLGLSINVRSLSEAGIDGEVVEGGTTLQENALKKARFAWQKSGTWCLADDTGLFIDALGGQPGIHAARWAGRDASTEEITHHTLRALRHVLPQERTATFRTVAAVVDPQGDAYVFEGEAPGIILAAARCEPQPKMPYSGIFVPNGSNKVWAEMSVEEENAISHRGKAFRQVREFFERQEGDDFLLGIHRSTRL